MIGFNCECPQCGDRLELSISRAWCSLCEIEYDVIDEDKDEDKDEDNKRDGE
jgi:Zn finger protein HypA/HybF involved in hydrogenase expression